MGTTKTVKALLWAVKFLLLFAVGFVFCWVLAQSGYFSEFSAIDNVLALLPFVFSGAACVLLGAVLFLKKTRARAALCVGLALFCAVCCALFPVSLTQSWWLGVNMTDEIGADPSLAPWKPFSGEKVAALDGPASLRLEEDLPVLDGALALYPVYAAAAQAVYERSACEAADAVRFTDTVRAFSELLEGNRDVVLMAGPSERQLAEARARGIDLVLTPIGKEAFVFLAGTENPVDGLTMREIRNIYSGKTASWRTLGWSEGGEIIAYRRPAGSGSESALERLMTGLPLASPRPLPDASLVGTNSLMQQISVRYRGTMPALGYSYRFFATVMNPNPEAKMLGIDGVFPTVETIASGAYPLTAQFFAVTRKDASGPANRLVSWLKSDEGQELIARVGYVPLENAEKFSVNS